MAANWLCIVISADGIRNIGSRTGQLVTIHMTLFCVGRRMSILTSYTYLSSHRQQIAHSWLGWITIGNGVVYSNIVLGIERCLELDGVGISGLVHSGPVYWGCCGITSIGLLAVGYISRFGHIWCGRCGTGRNARCLSVLPQVDAIQASIVVPWPWHFRAGQHIYQHVFRMGIQAFWQSHPFTIARWEGDRISMLIRPHGGFTRRLLLYAGCTLHALVEGPFGIEHDLGSYSAVWMFASGVGIAVQVPYICRLLEGRIIYRRLGNEGEAQRSPYIPGASEEHFGGHDCVNRVFGDLDIKYTLSAELDRRWGNTVVALRTGRPMIDEVGSTVYGALQQDMWSVELGVWPGPYGNSISSP
ncbi:hypothetical protein C7212DRAFT_343006 [Tuber magnatum]|uniref:ferric-chelate reductase (NADPH) n=1 Tax=Tuber magnatum TaxID=42249 RepID=A0A317SS46_9PEZI|nr:hypothetical protein C7212DRAFT_343006 [Tuber magnatum]